MQQKKKKKVTSDHKKQNRKEDKYTNIYLFEEQSKDHDYLRLDLTTKKRLVQDMY